MFISISSILLSTIFLFSTPDKENSVVINEVMQSNIDYLMVDNDFPDSWVELYNTTESSINVAGWRIGTKADAQLCYRLPATTIPAKGHLVIYCDKENNGLHTDFRVDSGKGSIYLFDNGGTQVDMLKLAKMPAANVAYGRTSDGASDWHYEFTPTAGSANTGGGAQTVLPQPLFSIKGGAYTSLTDWLNITMPEGVPDDATIVYTMDGTEPVLGREGGKRVSLPINKTYAIRAKIVSTTGQGVPSPSVTHSYIFHPREVTMPIVSLTTNDKYMNDSEVGILSSTVNDGVPNYMRKWRRPLNIEYIDADGKQVFTQLGETAVSGVSTREQPQKSLKLYANKRFGTKTFSGNFWKDKPEVTAVKSMVLRSGGNNSASSRINDALVQSLFGTHVDNLDWQAYQPVIVYLNGIYMGEYGLRERSNEDNIEANYDGLEDVEMADETSYQTPVEGTLFYDFYNTYHNANTTYSTMCEQLDLDNFMKSLAAEVYGMNTDYPTNNVSMWRALPLAEGDKPDALREANQRWRWILKDMDRFGMQLPMYPHSFDMIRYIFNPDDLVYGGLKHFDLYKKMGRYGDFSSKFADMMAVYLGDFLKPAVVKEKITQMRNEIETEVTATFSKYQFTMSDYYSGMNYLTCAADERPEYLYSQLSDYFKLGDAYPVTVKIEEHEVSMNGIKLTEGDFDGKYFANRTLTLSAQEGDTWKMTVESDGAIVKEQSYDTATISVPFPTLNLKSGASVCFQLIPGIGTNISNTMMQKNNSATYNIMGQQVKNSANGILIIDGKKIVK